MKAQKLTSEDELTMLVKSTGTKTWQETIEFVKALPYGRNSNRNDFKLVIIEQRGTCSSKHAMLKKVADLNNIPNVKLLLGLYKMNEKNTPKIGNALAKNSINYIPEAHCYLKIDEKKIDITTPKSSFDNLKNDIISEIEILPEQVSQFKVTYHHNFIKSWLKHTNSSFSFKHIWNIREQCINNLTHKQCN